MTKVSELHEKWMEDPEYRAEFEALEEEFSREYDLIKARVCERTVEHPKDDE